MISLESNADYHIHANYNDHSSSDMTVPNIIKVATEKGLNKIAITEHVRKTSGWIPGYLAEVYNIKKIVSDLEILPGFEAKILSDGTIDFPERYKQHYIIASFHTKYIKKEVWINALNSVLEIEYVDVIGHLAPEESFNLTTVELEDLARSIKKNDKVVELNAKYVRPPLEWVSVFKQLGVKFHLGSDAHRLQDIGDFKSINHLVQYVNA
jgi:histidinol phosphatase-like PHP family hydrolase